MDLIKKVQVTDSDHFTDFGNELKKSGKVYFSIIASGFQPASYQKRGINNFGLADMRGDEWRRTKRMVTPSFSAPRLKKTLPALNDCALKVMYQIIFIF